MIDEGTYKLLDSVFDLIKKVIPYLKWIPKYFLTKNIKELGIATKDEKLRETIAFDILFYDYFSISSLLKDIN